jgi:hypothetical protein
MSRLSLATICCLLATAAPEARADVNGQEFPVILLGVRLGTPQFVLYDRFEFVDDGDENMQAGPFLTRDLGEGTWTQHRQGLFNRWSSECTRDDGFHLELTGILILDNLWATGSDNEGNRYIVSLDPFRVPAPQMTAKPSARATGDRLSTASARTSRSH